MLVVRGTRAAKKGRQWPIVDAGAKFNLLLGFWSYFFSSPITSGELFVFILPLKFYFTLPLGAFYIIPTVGKYIQHYCSPFPKKKVMEYLRTVWYFKTLLTYDTDNIFRGFYHKSLTGRLFPSFQKHTYRSMPGWLQGHEELNQPGGLSLGE